MLLLFFNSLLFIYICIYSLTHNLKKEKEKGSPNFPLFVSASFVNFVLFNLNLKRILTGHVAPKTMKKEERGERERERERELSGHLSRKYQSISIIK